MVTDRLAKELGNRNTVGIVSTNSIDFVKEVFTSYENDDVVVLLKDENDEFKIKMTNVNKIIKPKNEYGWFNEKINFKSSKNIAQISFSSGTTGNPKGVLLSHCALNDVVDRLVDIMKIDSSISEYVGIPVNYSFGFGRCRVVSSVGGRFYVPEGGFNPFEIKEMLKRSEINAISAVPSLWRVLFDNQEIFGIETEKVKWIEIGSQYMSSEEKLRLSKIFPKATIVQHYGLTEASRSTFLHLNDTSVDDYESVGKGYGKTEIKLNDDFCIMIKGPHVSQKIIKDSEIVDNVDSNGWHTTNDLGSIKNGFIYYKGRSDDIINCGGIKVYPDIIEKRIRELLNIEKGIAVARGNDKVRGEIILICYLEELKNQTEHIKRAALKAASENEINGSGAIKLFPLSSFPTTDTGKIKRRILTEQYSVYLSTLKETENNYAENEDTGDLSRLEISVIGIWKEVLKTNRILPEDSFFDLGGDSLSAIRLIAQLEKKLNKKVTTMDLFSHPTLESLCKFLSESQLKNSNENWTLHTLKEKGNLPPFFFIGSTKHGQNLALKLDVNRPIYGLNIFGINQLYKERLESFTIEDLAIEFLKDIRKIQSHGPYFFGAYCADTKIAIEIARQLMISNQEIAFMAFFDIPTSYDGLQKRSNSEPFWKKAKNKFSSLGVKYLVTFSHRRFSELKRKIVQRRDENKIKKYREEGIELPLSLRDSIVIKRYIEATKEYKLKKIYLNIIAYRSEEWQNKPIKSLEDNIGEIRTYIIPGSHEDLLLKDESLAILAEKVKAELI